MCCATPPIAHPQIDRFLYSSDNQVVAGALLAVGIVNCGVQDEVDPALALLSGGWAQACLFSCAAGVWGAPPSRCCRVGSRAGAQLLA